MSLPSGNPWFSREVDEYARTRTWYRPVLPQGDAPLRLKFELKLAEYKGRLEADQHTKRRVLDSVAKICVLELLLQRGTVSYQEACVEAVNRYGGLLRRVLGVHSESTAHEHLASAKELLDEIRNALGVMEDYIVTGGEHCVRGTGLKLAPLQ